jgi:hypothetical protein
MNTSARKYGFLSTYNDTIFIWRDDDYAFSVSTPFSRTSTNPSVRESFLGWCCMVSAGYKYGTITERDALVSRIGLIMDFAIVG